MRLEAVVPNFKANTTFGLMDFYDFQGDSEVVEWKCEKERALHVRWRPLEKMVSKALPWSRWVVLFSHPADFTPVCTTELGRMATHDQEFKKRNVKLIALSCDKLKDHNDWVDDIKSYCPDIRGNFPYPIIADEKREIAVLLDMITETDKLNPEVAMTVRALYIIGPDRKLKLSMVYPFSTGRNVDEILRCIDSLQLVARKKTVATPANWTPGTKVMILPHVKDEELPTLFPNGVEKVSMPSGKGYVRTTTDY